MIYNRLVAYGKACRDFCVERRYSGRKHRLPKDLEKRKVIRVKSWGTYMIHHEITRRAGKAVKQN